MQSSLEFVLLMLGTAVIGVVVFRYLQLPSILGYLAVGVVIGPHRPDWSAMPSHWKDWRNSGWFS